MANPIVGSKRIARRRLQRDILWPDAQGVVFPTITGGWAQIPRTVPMVASLIDIMGGRESAGRLYVTLWAYEYGDGFVEVPDPAQLALEAGYLTSRAERTFVERVALLKKLGFLRTAPNGLRDHGFILLLDPNRVVAKIRREKPSSVPDRWWSSFQSRCATVGIDLSTLPELSELPDLASLLEEKKPTTLPNAGGEKAVTPSSNEEEQTKRRAVRVPAVGH